MNIILIGFRGAGKTSVGKALAKKLKMKYVSTDSLVEQKARRSISAIVKKSGWGKFREMEDKAVKQVCSLDRYVIDTGGGIILNSSNVKDLKKCGTVIWLRANIKSTERRLAKDEILKKRPSLTGKPLLQEIRQVMKERRAKYKKAADYVVDTSKLSVSEAVERVARFVSN